MSKSNFSRNAAQLAVGNSVAQLISIAMVPIITRLYDPAQYGIFSIFLGVVGILAPMSTLQYHAAIVLPENDHSAGLLRKLASHVVFAFSALCMVGAIVVAITVSYGLWDSPLVPAGAIWLIAPTVLFQGMLLVDSTWDMRCNKFGKVASSRVWSSVVDRLIGIGCGVWYPTAFFLATGRTLGSLVGWWYARGIKLKVTALSDAESEPLLESTGQLAHRYRHFAIFSSMAVLFSAAARELPVILLGSIYGSASAAYYALGLRVVNMPMMTVGDAVAKAFFQHTAVLNRNQVDLADPALRLIKVGLLFATPPLLLMAVHGQTLFAMIFGARWAEAGLYTTTLALVYLIQYVCRPIETLFDVLELQRPKLIFATIALVCRVGAIFGVVWLGGSVIMAVLNLTVVTVITQTAVMWFLLGKVGVTGKQVGAFLGRIMVLLAPVLVGVPISAIFLETKMALFVGVILLAAQMGGLLMIDQDLQQLLRRLTKRAG